ncbi:MAG: hypothetical protein R3B48_17140 [Kofleriaceae bacterium]
MPLQSTQISAYISDSTSSELETYVEARGLKKGYVIEQALRHHLRALRDLPADVIVPPQVVVSAETAERLVDRIRKPRTPTPAMRALFEKK